jgi:predicted transposase YbfD/YdcC
VEGNTADYILALKRNQPSMYNDTVLFFTDVDLQITDGNAKTDDGADPTVSVPSGGVKAAIERIYSHFAGAGAKALAPGGYSLPTFAGFDYQSLKTKDFGHGRIENRLYILVPDVSWLSRKDEWAGLKSVGMVISHVVNKKTGEASIDCRFYISSVDNVNRFAESARKHWGCEATHYVLDVAFSEDKNKTFKENGALNKAVFRRIALNFLKMEKEQYQREHPKKTMSYDAMRFKAALDSTYLEKVMIDNLM